QGGARPRPRPPEEVLPPRRGALDPPGHPRPRPRRLGAPAGRGDARLRGRGWARTAGHTAVTLRSIFQATFRAPRASCRTAVELSAGAADITPLSTRLVTKDRSHTSPLRGGPRSGATRRPPRETVPSTR